MSTRRIVFYLSLAFLLLILVGIPIKSQFFIQNGNELLAGRNINMVSGTKLPLGDPWLQRQNEPSIAVSSRNPMHLFAAANDYRTIDMPDDYNLPGIPGASAVRDSWIGVFESFNGGESSVTMLLPGFPQDTSAEGVASPIHGFDTACDPIVRAGARGLFYLSGITFNRNQQQGAVFVARYVDFNNRENVEEEIDPVSGYKKYVGPIKYIDTKAVDRDTQRRFIDMPNMAVDVPRGGATYGNVYVAYTVFLGDTTRITRSRILLVKSSDGGATWSWPTILSEFQYLVQRPVIVIDPSDSTGKTIYIVFRRFALWNKVDGIGFVKSVDGGKRFSGPADIATLACPFDQATTETSFRTNSYPTMAVDGNGIVYVAWAQRYGQNGLPNPDGQARIVISYSKNRGVTWSTPLIVDQSYQGDGHQFMPTMTFGGGKLRLAWYDQRDDISLHHPNTKFIEDAYPTHRHTIDVRAAEGTPGAPPIFQSSILVSRYLYYMQLDENGEPTPFDNGSLVMQGEYNFINFPLFHLGTKPFQGDYIEIASSPQILPPPATASNSWVFNTSSSEPTTSPIVWTDTRDVWPPAGNIWGDWISYNPPTSIQEGDFEQQNPCNNSDTTGMRNQNIYAANLNHGVIVGSPGNTKQLDIPRTFVVFVKNTTEYSKSLTLTVSPSSGVPASFEQFSSKSSLDVTVPPYSSVSSTVYAGPSGSNFGSVRVDVTEGGTLVGRIFLNPDSTNNPILDPDGNTLGNESHNPIMSNPKIWKYYVGNQNEPNASFLSPRAQNPRAQNSGYVNPRAQNEGILNPRAQNENIVNNEMYNPRAQNPRAQNAALTDMTWTVSNDGNTTSAYSFDIVSNDEDIRNLFNQDDPPLIAQVLVYKVHTVPIDKECALLQTHADELIVNVTNPRAQNPRAQNYAPGSGNFTTLGVNATTQQNSNTADITFNLAPGEQAEVTFRVYDPDTTDEYSFDDYIDNFAGETEAEAANTGETVPILVTQDDVPWVTPLPEIGVYPASLLFDAVSGSTPADQTITIWNSGSGTLDYTISDDTGWLSVSPLSGTSTDQYDENSHTVSVNIAGLTPGTYPGTITITDPNATNNPVRLPVTLTIYAAPPSGEWVMRYDGPAHVDDHAAALATDSAGNVYVTGAGTFPDTGRDIVTIKYNAAGSVVWTSRYDAGNAGINNNDSPTAIAVDSSGNVFVTGTQEYGAISNQDWITIKYNNLGIRQWAVDYDGNPNADDIPRAIAVDSTGNVYVTGESPEAPSIFPDFLTIKYGPSGNRIWASRYAGFGGSDMAKALALDSSGNVYVAGTSSGLYGDFDYALVRYNNAGVQQWVKGYDGPLNGNDEVSVVAVDSSDNIYVGGSSEGSTASFDYCTIKFDSDGEVVWLRRYDRVGGHDLLNAMALDSSGNVCVTGRSDYGLVPDPISDYATIKYDSSGTQQWVALYDGPDHVQDVAWDIAIDPAGNIYVAGESDGPGTSFDCATIKYDGSGNELWVRRYNGPGNFNDSAAAVVIDPEGNVVITGSSTGSGTGQDFATIKYRPTLQEWVFNWGSPGSDSGNAIALDSSGNAYVTGVTPFGSGKTVYTLQIFSNGNPGWIDSFSNGGAGSQDTGISVAVHGPSGDVYVAGSVTQGGTGLDYYIQKIVPAALPSGWIQFYDGGSAGNTDIANAMTIDAAGNVYVTGRSWGTGTDYDYATIKYNSTGALQWVARYNGTANGTDMAAAIAVDSSGNVYVTGWSDHAPGVGIEYSIVTVKYDSSGIQQWAEGFSAYSYGMAYAIAVDLSGNVYVTGRSDWGPSPATDDIVTIKYDTNGNFQWVKNYDGPGHGDDNGQAVAVDPSGNVYVTGYCIGDGSGDDYVTIKYDAGGNVVWARRYNGPVNGNDLAYDIALDSSGKVIVTGKSFGISFDDYATVTYDTNGNELWVMRYNSVDNSYDDAFALAVDSSGNVFVTGMSFRTGKGFDSATIKYRKEGT